MEVRGDLAVKRNQTTDGETTVTGGLKDANVVTAIKLGSVADTSFSTTKKDIVGAVNEVSSNSLLNAIAMAVALG